MIKEVTVSTTLEFLLLVWTFCVVDILMLWTFHIAPFLIQAANQNNLLVATVLM